MSIQAWLIFGGKGVIGIFTRSSRDFDKGAVLNEIVGFLAFLSSSNDRVRSG